MFVHQKAVRNPHNLAEAKKGISWPLICCQKLLAQLLVCFALKVVPKPPEKTWCGNQPNYGSKPGHCVTYNRQFQ
jgi:hypothetical protein